MPSCHSPHWRRGLVRAVNVYRECVLKAMKQRGGCAQRAMQDSVAQTHFEAARCPVVSACMLRQLRATSAGQLSHTESSSTPAAATAGPRHSTAAR